MRELQHTSPHPQHQSGLAPANATLTPLLLRCFRSPPASKGRYRAARGVVGTSSTMTVVPASSLCHAPLVCELLVVRRQQPYLETPPLLPQRLFRSISNAISALADKRQQGDLILQTGWFQANVEQLSPPPVTTPQEHASQS